MLTRLGQILPVGMAVMFLALGATAARAQTAETVADPPQATDSLTGAWESRSHNPAYGGQLYLHLTLQQEEDSLTGTVVLEYHGQASEAPVDLVGTIRGGRFTLSSRAGVMHVTGTLRDGRLQTRIVPGRAAEMSAFSAAFVRAP